jgi:hypothetical protein
MRREPDLVGSATSEPIHQERQGSLRACSAMLLLESASCRSYLRAFYDGFDAENADNLWKVVPPIRPCHSRSFATERKIEHRREADFCLATAVYAA